MSSPREKTVALRSERIRRARGKTPTTPEPGFPATRLRPPPLPPTPPLRLVAAAGVRDDTDAGRSHLADLSHRGKERALAGREHAGRRAAFGRSRSQGGRDRGGAEAAGGRAVSIYQD